MPPLDDLDATPTIPTPAGERLYVCSYHPDRRAQGVCMSCRQVICNECSTKIDGINHCLPCLERKATAGQGREHRLARKLAGFVSGLVLVALLVLGVAGLLLHHGTWGAG